LWLCRLQDALHERKEFILGTRRHTRAPKITLITSSIAVTRAKRVSFSRLKTLLEAKGVKFDHIDLALQDRAQEVEGISGLRELPQVLINDKYVGGAEEIQELEDDGALDDLLGIDLL
jgi:glutaredoxin